MSAIELAFGTKCVRRFPYRTARASRRLLTVYVDPGSALERQVDLLRRQWCEEIGEKPDNHEGYEFLTAEGDTLYVFYSDRYIVFSLSVQIRNW